MASYSNTSGKMLLLQWNFSYKYSKAYNLKESMPNLKNMYHRLEKEELSL